MFINKYIDKLISKCYEHYKFVIFKNYYLFYLGASKEYKNR